MGPKIEHKIVDGVECKMCSFHKTFESLDKFGKDSHSADGLRNKCKESRLGTYKRLTEDFKSNYEKYKIEDGKYFKWCKRHNEFEPLENFNIYKRSFDGLMPNCRTTTKQSKSKIYDECIKKSKEKINKILEDAKQKNKILEKNNEIEKVKKEENNEIEKQKENGKKKCNKCEEFKDFKEFSKDSSASLGLANLCRKCKCPGSGERIGKKSRAEHIIINGVDGKECTGCKEWKSFKNNNYKKAGFYKDGIIRYESHCKTCTNERTREIYNQEDNKIERLKINFINELSKELYKRNHLKIYKRPEKMNGSNCMKHDRYYKKCFECYPNENLEYNKLVREKIKNNPVLRLKIRMSGRITTALNGISSCKTYDKLLGLPIEEYFDYL